MRRIACARFGEDSSRMGVLMSDSTSGMASCSGMSGSAMSRSGWTGSSTGCIALWGMLGSEAGVSL